MSGQVVGSGPVTFTDVNGSQESIPLSVLYLDDKNVIKADKWPLYTKNASIVDAWLKYLVSNQLLMPAVVPSQKPAMILKAAKPGASGNNIQVTITYNPKASDFLDPTKPTFDLTVTQTETHPGLSTANIPAKLGTDKSPLTNPGLVHVVENTISNSNILPDDSKSFPLKLPASNAAFAKVDILVKAASTPTVVFTLEASLPGAEGELISVSFTADVDPQTFTLKAVLTKTITGNNINTLEQNLAALKDVITVTPSGILSFPQENPGSPVALSGGADSPPSTASAIIFARQ
jgi:hypothetical protein